MDEQKKFSASLLGLSKKDVNTYITSLSQELISGLEQEVEKNAKLIAQKDQEVRKNAELAAQLEQLAEKNAELIAQKDQEVRKNAELVARLDKLALQVAKLEEERSYISDALVKAKQEAERIVAEAEEEAAQRLAGVNADLDTVHQAIIEESGRLNNLLVSAKSALEYYTQQLEAVVE